MPNNAEEAALQLSTLLQGPAGSQLLQQPPPAKLTVEQQSFLINCDARQKAISHALEQLSTTTAGRGLGLLLRHKAAHSIGILLVWLQQQPQQLQFGLLQQKIANGGAGGLTTADLWVRGAQCLAFISRALVHAVATPQSGYNAAAVAAATLQQLEQSGLLSSMHASLVPLVQAISQQWTSTPGHWTPFSQAFDTVRAFMIVTEATDQHARALVPAALQHTAVLSVVRLLQQVQSCGPLLPAAAAAATSPDGGSSSSFDPHQHYVSTQCSAANFINMLFGLFEQPHMPASVLEQLLQVLLDPASQLLLLQPLIAHVTLLHQHHEAQQQQQRHVGAGVGLLPIPAFHQDLLQLLPGQQAYLDAAASLARTGDDPRPQDNSMRLCWERADVAVVVLGVAAYLLLASRDSHQLGADALFFSGAAVRLVLELQLLAADCSKMQQQDYEDYQLAVFRLGHCNKLLEMQIRGFLRSTNGSCLPPEVLQQAGLQLLQALAAPVQQVLLRGCQATAVFDGTSHQLYALRAAAAGVAVEDDDTAMVEQGQLPSLAAAHPEAYTALIDCCVRLPLLEAEDMLAAAELLEIAFAAVLSSEAALRNTAAVAGLASALTSLVKRTVQFAHSATDINQAQAAGNHSSAVAYFLAVVPRVAEALFGEDAVLQGTALPAVNSLSSQARASAALLAVASARSLVQLADAMQAAGPQLLFESLQAQPELHVSWDPAATYAMSGVHVGLLHGERFPSVEGQWQQLWQRRVLSAAEGVWNSLVFLGLAAGPAAETRASDADPNVPAAAATAAAGASNADSCSPAASSSSGGSSSSRQQVKWGYLLGLQQSQPRWTAAAAKYVAGGRELARQLGVEVASDLHGVCLADIPASCDVGQRCADALELCRALAAAAPLPVVCNNPSCANLAGVSECAASCKVCAGCKCRYCSAACQAADWRRHKHACRLMAAAGVTCT